MPKKLSPLVGSRCSPSMALAHRFCSASSSRSLSDLRAAAPPVTSSLRVPARITGAPAAKTWIDLSCEIVVSIVSSKADCSLGSEKTTRYTVPSGVVSSSRMVRKMGCPPVSCTRNTTLSCSLPFKDLITRSAETVGGASRSIAGSTGVIFGAGLCCCSEGVAAAAASAVADGSVLGVADSASGEAAGLAGDWSLGLGCPTSGIATGVGSIASTEGGGCTLACGLLTVSSMDARC
mmetsp:Transcript_43749/g.121056  ORF Transcript_43749/g.121056 Transcript_43749/m.121056 type:complete len:235 (-) Transcript_43749:426-1130(-)